MNSNFNLFKPSLLGGKCNGRQYLMRTLILRSLHFVQPYLDFLCGRRDLCSDLLPLEPDISSIMMRYELKFREEADCNLARCVATMQAACG
jgi:hypothetical protein